MKLHIVESDGTFLVVELFHYNQYHLSKIHPVQFKTLDKAQEYVKVTSEDAVPVNSVSGGNVSNFSPLLLRKIGKRRLTKYMQNRKLK